MAGWDTKKQRKMAKRYSYELRARKVPIITLAVGEVAKNESARETIASWSSSFFTSGFQKLNEVVQQIVNESCAKIKPGTYHTFSIVLTF